MPTKTKLLRMGLADGVLDVSVEVGTSLMVGEVVEDEKERPSDLKLCDRGDRKQKFEGKIDVDQSSRSIP